MLILGLMIAWSGAAMAHAYPKKQKPVPNATLQEAPKQVAILFSEALEPAFSSLKVTNQQANTVNRGDSHVASDNPRRMVAPLQSLQPGIYTVHWHAVSVDGHTTEGQYQFSIKP